MLARLGAERLRYSGLKLLISYPADASREKPSGKLREVALAVHFPRDLLRKARGERYLTHEFLAALHIATGRGSEAALVLLHSRHLLRSKRNKAGPFVRRGIALRWHSHEHPQDRPRVATIDEAREIDSRGQ